LVDLLDRILDRGLILNTDLIIHVAGIPLLGINLKACLAGMETMLKYGIWRDWDEAQRAIAADERRRKKDVPLMPGEEVLLRAFASQWCGEGIYRSWRPGQLYVTNRRMLLFRKQPAEVLFQCPYEAISGMTMTRGTSVAGKETDYLLVSLVSGEVVQLHPINTSVVRDAIEDRMKALGLALEDNLTLEMLDENAAKILSDGEEVVHSGKMSHLVVEPRPGGTTADVWKPGRLYLTGRRLVWWYDFDGKVAFEVPLDQISRVEVKRKDLGGMLKNRAVLDLAHANGLGGGVASFCDAVEELEKWQRTISEVATGSHSGVHADDDTEECPRCGSKASATRLLHEGCAVCGWVSPRLRSKGGTALV
jgi:ribosomal protein L37E